MPWSVNCAWPRLNVANLLRLRRRHIPVAVVLVIRAGDSLLAQRGRSKRGSGKRGTKFRRDGKSRTTVYGTRTG